MNFKANPSSKVCAVIVTYNRKELLLRCLDSLISQSKPLDGILIIDNASTDGTYDLLNSRGYLTSNSVTYVLMSENSGGAGGFNEGIKRAASLGYDWLWLMDDDVEPNNNCLFELLQNTNGYDVIQPYRYYDENNFVKSECRTLNFSNPFLPLKRSFIEAPSIHKDAEIACFPFEGPLLRCSFALKAGLPIKDYFIIADDTEYSIRLKKLGANFRMCSDAHVKRLIKPVYNKNLNWKSYYQIRNMIDIDKRNSSTSFMITRSLVTLIKYLMTTVLYRRSISSYRILFMAIFDGIFSQKRDIEEIRKFN